MNSPFISFSHRSEETDPLVLLNSMDIKKDDRTSFEKQLQVGMPM